MIKTILPLILFLAFCININAQQQTNSENRDAQNLDNSSSKAMLSEKSSKEIAGDKYFFIYDFNKAIGKYVRVNDLTLNGLRNLSESYRNVGKYEKSEEVYLKLINAQSNVSPEDYYNYASLLKYSGKYTEAFKMMDKFSALNPLDARAIDYVENKHKFESISKDDGTFKINQLNINSNADDYATSFYGNKIVFVSNKSLYKMIARIYNWTGKPFWNMYVSEIEDGELKKPESFTKEIRSKYHDGPVSFSNDGTFMAFTRNKINDKSEDDVVELLIFFSSYVDEKWTEPVPFKLNNKEYQVEDPCLTPDGNTMYFASNMPGGFGGSDLYKVTRVDNGEWGAAVNLGSAVNTEGDEMFPFFESANKILFFTSNGRFGLGGLDIFYCSVNGSDFGNVKNAGYPLNTQYDDFAAIIDSQLNKGYISSNRSGGSGGDDIYSFDLLKNLKIDKRIEGIAMDKNGEPISGALVILLDNNDDLIDSMTTNNLGTFSFFADADKNFTLTAEREDYDDATITANTFSKERIVKADITLFKEEIIVVQKEETESPKITEDDKDDKVKIGNLNTIYFDMDKSNIREDAEIELNKIVKIMNDNPDLVVEIRSYTDSRGSKDYNIKLSTRRANSTLNYIKSRINNPERIYGKGYGETTLVNDCAGEGNIVSNCSEKQHQANRRTEFYIVKQ